MNHRIYYVGVGWDPRLSNVPATAVDQILDPVSDWIRFNDRTWFCSTSISSKELYDHIRERLPQLDRVLIIAIDPSDRFGLAPDWIWEWIDGQRQDPPKTAQLIIQSRYLSVDPPLPQRRAPASARSEQS